MENKNLKLDGNFDLNVKVTEGSNQIGERLHYSLDPATTKCGSPCWTPACTMYKPACK